MTHHKSNRLLGLRIDRLTSTAFLDQVIETAKRGERGYCCITNVHSCIMARDSKQFRNAIDKATIAIPDSTILQRAYALRFGAVPLTATHGAKLMMKLCKMAAIANVPIGFYGGKNHALLGDLRRHVQTACPKAKINFAHAPPFRTQTQSETNDVIKDINRSGVRMLFVGIGCPKQELWMAQNTNQINAIMIGIGAAFDINAGVIRRSPDWIHIYGLEWLFRLMKEPKRLAKRYLTTGPRFIYLLLGDWINSVILKRNQTTNR